MRQILKSQHGHKHRWLLDGPHLDATDHVVANHYKQIQRTFAQVWPELLLEYRQQRTFGQADLEGRVQRRPGPTLRAYTHLQGHKGIRRRVG